MILHKLKSAELLNGPKWLPDSCAYLAVTGSTSYSVSTDDSDMDTVGYCLPPKDLLFSHVTGHVSGFGTAPEMFAQFQQHHIVSPDSKTQYDVTVYSIVKFFHLCMGNNPNMVDVLFSPQRCVLHTSDIGDLVRKNRTMFLSRASYHKFRGFAYKQLKEIRENKVSKNPKRQAEIDTYGYNIKNGYHVVRLLDECEQILTEGDLNIERSKEVLKSIRRGEWTLAQLEEYFANKQVSLEIAHANSPLPLVADENKIKNLLVSCLEQHYGRLDNLIAKNTKADDVMREMQSLLDRYR